MERDIKHALLGLRKEAGVALSAGVFQAPIQPGDEAERQQARIHHALETWYRERALERLRDKARRYARVIGVAPRGISIRAFKARWGSCHHDDQLVFNWPINKAPHSIVDDVVIHELCHLVHANHSKEFWQLVRRHDAAFAAHREWLKEKARELL